MTTRVVPVEFLLGPAGSGKTWRCLAEVRAALRADPDGAPLLLLAPKQATFQLERQVVADATVPGYTRLQILSFERLAEFILTRQGAGLPPLLNEEGRVMVLRALLSQARAELTVFHATARLPGLARHLGELVVELAQHDVTPERLRALANEIASDHPVQGKLRDLAMLLSRYDGWLGQHQLEDQSRLLGLATNALHHPGGQGGLRFGGLWLDGFAEMTPQELDLLAAIVPCCARTTLAFCLAGGTPDPQDWLSAWALVGNTQRQLRQRLSMIDGLTVSTVRLPLPAVPTRFSACPGLAHLERCWPVARPFTALPGTEAAGLPIRLVRCRTPEGEARTAARAILRFVRDEGGRFRESAVLVRALEAYHPILRRVFARYGIPVFVDQRESVTHHPLAELTRSALRLAAFGWQTEDWMSALKTGLVGEDEAAIDRLENAALAHGWNGETWLAPLPRTGEDPLVAQIEPLRRQLVAPLAGFTRRLKAGGVKPTGARLVSALQELWSDLRIGTVLEGWSRGADGSSREGRAPVHATVWSGLNACLENLGRAFAAEAMPLREWIPIVEAGLANLTVGLIPPALDHVLVGAIDRSRNPDLKLVILLGWNDAVFPAPIRLPALLTESERRELAARGLSLGPDRRGQVGRERYYAYIAATRARERLVVTFAERDANDHPLNPSPFVSHLRRLFPNLAVEVGGDRPDWPEVEHASEAVVPWLRMTHGTGEGGSARLFPAVRSRLRLPLAPSGVEWEASVAPALAERLYGPGRLRTSVSRFEQFAACPFRFFVHSGLRAQERERFEVDVRQAGSFQHEVLARFHAAATAQGRWRELTPAAARDLVARLAAELLPEFGNGLFRIDARRRFEAQALGLALQDFVEVLVTWMRETYTFEPALAEFEFGGSEDGAPAWELDLGAGHSLALRGKIDRIDLARDPAGEKARCVVIDYKSSERRVDSLLLEHGIQMQLPVYLAAVRALSPPQLGPLRLEPVGMFYVNLRGVTKRQAERNEALVEPPAPRREGYTHRGRFSLSALPALDGRWNQPEASGQFSFAKGGKPSRAHRDPLPEPEFAALLARVEATLRRLGQQVFAGVARVSPYLKGASQTACQTCLYRTICRFDPWLHEYRRLGAVEAEEV